MILRKKSDFDNLMGFTDFELSEWQQWDLSDKEIVLDQITFDMGSRRRMREEEQIWQKSQQRNLFLLLFPPVAWELWLVCCWWSFIRPGLVLELLFCKLQDNSNYPSNLLSPNFKNLGRNKKNQLKWIS